MDVGQLGRGRAFAYSFLVQIGALVLLAVAPVFVSFLIASALMGSHAQGSLHDMRGLSGRLRAGAISAAAFALISVGAGLGSTVSPAIGGVLADFVDMRWVFWLATGDRCWGFSVRFSSTPRDGPTADTPPARDGNGHTG